MKILVLAIMLLSCSPDIQLRRYKKQVARKENKEQPRLYPLLIVAFFGVATFTIMTYE